MSEKRFCPKCNRIMDYDPYYKAWFCTSCSYRKYDKKSVESVRALSSAGEGEYEDVAAADAGNGENT